MCLISAGIAETSLLVAFARIRYFGGAQLRPALLQYADICVFELNM